MMINNYTLIKLDDTSSYNHNQQELKLQTIENQPLLSRCLPYHSSRHKYLNLCNKLNQSIKKLHYKEIEGILNNEIFINDPKSMKYIFRSLSSCYSFCPLCRTESKNPIQKLLTLRIQNQQKCNKIIEILKLFVESLKSIHEQTNKSSNNNHNNCRCFECCKKRCNHETYITEERDDIVKRKYEVLHIKDEIENDYDYLNLCIIPQKSTKPKYDIQVIQYLLENNLVSLLPHHFVFAVMYRRKRILKYLFHQLSTYKPQDTSMLDICKQLWLPKQFFFTQTKYIPWLQHPTRISIIGFALQSHLLDPDVIQILLNNGLSPNFDDLMALTAIAGDKRLINKRKIVKYILNHKYDTKICRHFLFDYGVYWFEVCLYIHCYKTAAMISTKLLPIIMETVLNEEQQTLIPKDVLNIILEYTLYPTDPDDGWLDIDGDRVLNGGINLEFQNLMGYFAGGPEQHSEKAKELVPPRVFWQDQREYAESKGNCIDIIWETPEIPNGIKLPFSFNIGDYPSINKHNDQDLNLTNTGVCKMIVVFCRYLINVTQFYQN